MLEIIGKERGLLMWERLEDIGEVFTPIPMALITGVLLFLLLGGLHWVNIKENNAFETVPVVLETKLGIETEYDGHKIVYAGLSHSYSQYDDINLLVDGKLLTLSPRASLDEVGAGWKPRYAFFLPEGRKLILKEVSEDRSILKWTDVDWSQN